MPIPLAAVAALAPVAGQAIEMPFKIYGAIEQMKMDRKRARQEEAMRRFQRLMAVNQAAQGKNQTLSGLARLAAIRNGATRPRPGSLGGGEMPEI